MEQLSFDIDELNSFDKNTKTTDNVANKDDIFACCHLYRECSDAGKCISECDGTENCIYRKNLENGVIFYGKKANDFNMDTYDAILKKYNSLDADVRKELDCAILYFVKYRTTVLWYSSNEIELLCKLGFCELSRSPRRVLELCHNKIINSFLDANTRKILNQQCKKRTANSQARATKQDVIEWLMNNPTPAFKEYAGKFVYLSFPSNMHRYIFEIYYDFLKEMTDTYANDVLKKLPMMNEPSFTGYLERTRK